MILVPLPHPAVVVQRTPRAFGYDKAPPRPPGVDSTEPSVSPTKRLAAEARPPRGAEKKRSYGTGTVLQLAPAAV
jgi:hypothetical protein